MSNVKISALPAATTPLTGTELVPLVQSGVTSQVAVSNIKTAPAGSNTQVQFNNSSAFGASASLTWDGTTLAATKFSGALNGTVGATTPSTGAFTTLTTTGTINLLTVGRGGGAVSTNTAVGASALAATATGAYNSAFGRLALTAVTSGASNTGIGEETLATISTASDNTAVGASALYTSNGARNTAVGVGAAQATSSGIENTAIGHSALRYNTTATGSTAVGYQALYTSNRTADVSAYNLGVGYQSGYGLTTGQYNTFVGGNASGWQVTSGSNNVIIGNYSGGAAPISTTGSNFVVLSDGAGNVVASSKTAQTFALQGGTLSTGTGIAFPATQSASTDANTLDDYEEGTWTPGQGAGLTVVGAYTSSGKYVKIGRQVFVSGVAAGATTIASSANSIGFTGLPFASSGTAGIGSMSNASLSQVGATYSDSTNVYVTAMTAAASLVFSLVYHTT